MDLVDSRFLHVWYMCVSVCMYMTLFVTIYIYFKAIVILIWAVIIFHNILATFSSSISGMRWIDEWDTRQ